MIVSYRQLVRVVWISIGILATYLSLDVWQSYRTAEDAAGREAVSMARLVARHASMAIGRADVILMDAADYLLPSDFSHGINLPESRRRDIEAVLRRHQAHIPGAVSMLVTDAGGKVLGDSTSAAPGTDLSDDQYFVRLKAGPRPLPEISEAKVGRVSGKWGTTIARRIELPDGRFAGMIASKLGLTENFEKFYETIDLGAGSVITLRDAHNRILVRYPVVREALGTIPPDTPIGQAIKDGQQEGIAVGTSSIDGISRVVAFRKADDYPIFAVVGISREAALNRWRLEFEIYVAVILGAIGCGIFLTRTLRQRELLTLDLIRAKNAAEASDKAKSHFLAATSHDLRQPMQAIFLFLDGLAISGLNDKQQDMARHLRDSANGLRDILNTLLNLAHIDGGKVEPQWQDVVVDDVLRKLVAECEPMAANKGLSLRWHGRRRPLVVRTDPGLLREILRNLVDNAIKYTESGGILLTSRVRDGQCVLQVWDTGCGISPDQLVLVFDEFFQIGNRERDRRKGLGLGLTIAKRLASLIGAGIGCRSRQGRGSVFELKLGPEAR
jgi:signal transduction histidine kinase